MLLLLLLLLLLLKLFACEVLRLDSGGGGGGSGGGGFLWLHEALQQLFVVVRGVSEDELLEEAGEGKPENVFVRGTTDACLDHPP